MSMDIVQKGEGRGIGLYDVKILVHKNKGDLIVQNGQRDGVIVSNCGL